MNTRERSRLHSYHAIAEFFEMYEKDLLPVSSSHDIIRSFISTLRDIVNHSNSLPPETISASTVRQQHNRLVTKLSLFCNALHAWMHMNGNPAHPAFSAPRSAIQLKTHDALADFTRQVLNAYAHLNEKPDYTIIHQGTASELEIQLQEFMKARSGFRQFKSQKAGHEVILREHIQNMERQLVKADALMKLFKNNNPLLYIAYTEARKIREKTYEAKPLFSDIIHPNSTRTVSTIHYQANAWIVIQNRAPVSLNVHLSLLKDIALGEGVTVLPESTVYRQLKNLHADPQAIHLVVKNEDRKDGGILEIRMG